MVVVVVGDAVVAVDPVGGGGRVVSAIPVTGEAADPAGAAAVDVVASAPPPPEQAIANSPTTNSPLTWRITQDCGTIAQRCTPPAPVTYRRPIGGPAHR